MVCQLKEPISFLINLLTANQSGTEKDLFSDEESAQNFL